MFWTIFIFFIKENWICAMTRHHAESNINILLTRNLPIDSDVRHWSHSLMMQLHYLWAKLNKRTCGQFKCDVTWFCFCFNFVRLHARCSYCSIVCFLFFVAFFGGDSFKIGCSKSRGWENFGLRWTGAEGSWKLDNFQRRHLCIVPKKIKTLDDKIEANEAQYYIE